MDDHPRLDPYDLPASAEELDKTIAILREHVTDARWERMQAVLDQRTRYLATAVEDIYQPHNASAVLRSCDAFGIQDVHIIENRNRYQVNPGVELGTAQWLSMYRYTRGAGGAGATRSEAGGDRSEPRTHAAVATLHRLGYRVIATSPHRDDVTLETLDLAAGPVALLFGTEKEGLSATALDLADGYMRIPMYGFVESLNISVSAAVTMQALSARLRRSEISWQLSGEDRRKILGRWLRRSVRHGDLILERAALDH